MNKRVALVSSFLSACGGAPSANVNPPDAPAIVRTGDPYERGYTEADFPRVQKLAEGVFSYEQLRASGGETFTTVSLFIITDEGVVVADGQGSPEETRRLVEHIADVTEQPIRRVVICSDHADHTGGNLSFPKGAVFYGHPTSRATLERMGAFVLPTELVEDERVLILGGREIRIVFLGRAHTGGDLHVYLPREKILFMSEAFLNRIFPAMRSAYPSEWVEMVKRAQAMDVDIYVPGHGFVEEPSVLAEELQTYREAMETVIAEAKRLHAQGLSVEEAGLRANFGELESWTLRSSQGARAIAKVYEELNGQLQ